MPGIFEGRHDEQALWAAIRTATGLYKIGDFSDSDSGLVRAIACDSSYRQVLSGADEKTFVSFPETQQRLPHVYAKLAELGYKAIESNTQSKG